jgi:hypothetical protein
MGFPLFEWESGLFGQPPMPNTSVCYQPTSHHFMPSPRLRLHNALLWQEPIPQVPFTRSNPTPRFINAPCEARAASSYIPPSEALPSYAWPALFRNPYSNPVFLRQSLQGCNEQESPVSSKPENRISDFSVHSTRSSGPFSCGRQTPGYFSGVCRETVGTRCSSHRPLTGHSHSHSNFV